MRLIFAALLLTFLGLPVQAQERAERVDEISDRERELFNDMNGEISVERAASIIPLYLEFVNHFPEDSMSPQYLFKAGEVAQGVGLYMESVEYFNGVHMRYPMHERAPYALFFQGFVFYNFLQYPQYAKGSFLDFLDKYPGHILEKDVRAMLQLLHSSEEEYFRIIIEKNE